MPHAFHRALIFICSCLCITACCFFPSPLHAASELASFTIEEPLAIHWKGEWLTHRFALKRQTPADSLVLVAEENRSVAAQFSMVKDPRGKKNLFEVLYRTDLPKNSKKRFHVINRSAPFEPGAWKPIRIEESGATVVVENSFYTLVFDSAPPLPINKICKPGTTESIAQFSWPNGEQVKSVAETIKPGPARCIIKRSFTFSRPDLVYEITFDMRAEDPWIGIVDRYSLGKGSAIKIDLSDLHADRVFHPHTYNARTFKAGGTAEDSTLEPPQHPIATLGPIWRDIWFGGGPFAFVYKTGDPSTFGLGFAAVKESLWKTPAGITPESQNIHIHGHERQPGKVFAALPADGGTRHWALVVGPSTVRKSMGRMVRSHADTPLQKVLTEWVLDWETSAPEFSYGFAYQWLDYFNKHMLNPTTFPRRIKVPEGPVKSKELAVLAYQFTNPDYWPGPNYKWRIGNPNFHTDMYRIPLMIGLAMPGHPHAKDWVQYGVEETRANLYRDSFPGGAWAESLSYSTFFFHVAQYAKLLHDSGAARPFHNWSRIKEVATYLACMHTPVDPRYGTVQKAPIGDTAPGNYVEELHRVADYYRNIDPDFARKLGCFPQKGDDALDISSRAFYGFGAMMRGSAYDRRFSSFATVKAGPARNHFQGDELSFYFASLSTPLAIDYACHYSPRPWSASMHNRPDLNGARPVGVGIGRVFKTSAAADVFVADERTWKINEVPMLPHHTAKPGWNYPWRDLPAETPWIMRRYAMLVKHAHPQSPLADYLVIADEIHAPEVPWWNLHMLARSIERRKEGHCVFHFPGQLGVDVDAHVLSPAVETFENRKWGWSTGNSAKRRTAKGEEYEAHNFGDWIPEDFIPGTWKGGEMAKWLRLRGRPGKSRWLVALIPYRKGETPPVVRKISATSFEVRKGETTETVRLGEGEGFQAAVKRNGTTTILLKHGEVRPLSDVSFSEKTHRSERADEKE